MTFLLSALQFLVTVNVPSSLIPFTLMMEAIHSSEMSVLTAATRRHISEDDILHLYWWFPSIFPVHPASCQDITGK
jgi:hypothetical protein